MKFYHCEFCDYKSKYTSCLKRHKRYKHDIDVKWFHCELCDFKSKTNGDLKSHKTQIHDIDVKWFHCSEQDCESKFKTNVCLKSHKSFVHNIGIKWVYCDLCDYKCKRNNNLKKHKIHVHDIDVKWYNCYEPNCEYKCKANSDLKRHFNSMHTPQGQARRKKEENKIKLLLEKNNIKFDREQKIDFSCFNSGKNYAKIDFIIYRKDYIILLEVDENQHKYGEWYSVSCDMKRMSHVITAIRCEGKRHTILFLRYNPNSFRVENKLKKVSSKDRQNSLIEILNSYKPSTPESLEIMYMFYDKEQEEDKIPLIVKSDEYKLRKCVQNIELFN